MRNIEQKFQIADKTGLLNFLSADSRIRFVFRRAQEDIYFNRKDGRLKMRLVPGETAQLIFYRRSDLTAARLSEYSLTPVENPSEKIAELAEKYGERGRVSKLRELYLFRNVRIHLDEVAGLGGFLEFESVVGPDADEPTARQNLNLMLDLLKPFLGSAIPVSYIDLILTRKEKGSEYDR